MEYDLLEVIPDQKLVLRGKTSTVEALDTLTFVSIGPSETEIHYRADLSFLGGMAKAEFLLGPWCHRIGKKAVAGLHRALTPETALREESLLSKISAKTLVPLMATFTERGYLAMPNKGLSEYMNGKTVVLTGPTSGLGLAAACEFSRLGANLILVGRDPERLAHAKQRVLDFSGADEDRVRVFEAELSLVSEVHRIGAEIRASTPRIDVLVNNAGAVFSTRKETSEGHELSLSLNLLVPWTLTEVLLPALRASRGRVIQVSTGGIYTQAVAIDDLEFRHGDYDGLKAYARAKRALVAATEAIAERETTMGSGVTLHSMHPGWAATPGVERSLPRFNQVLRKTLRDSRMGADTIVWLACSQAVQGVSGRFWFDRIPRSTEVLPGTALGPKERITLSRWLETQSRLRS